MTDAHHTDEFTRWFLQMEQPEYYAMPANPDIPGARTDYSNPRLPQPRARVVTPEFREELDRRMQRLQREAKGRSLQYAEEDRQRAYRNALCVPPENAAEVAAIVVSILEALGNGE
jgi:hypothetical protein